MMGLLRPGRVTAALRQTGPSVLCPFGSPKQDRPRRSLGKLSYAPAPRHPRSRMLSPSRSGRHRGRELAVQEDRQQLPGLQSLASELLSTRR